MKKPTKKSKTEVITLTEAQRKSFAEHDQIIKDGLATFVKVGVALKAIQKDQLFLAEFKTFTEYCGARLNMSGSQGYRLMDAVDVFANVKGVADIDPISESQIRSLKHLKPANQRKAWKKAVGEMGKKKKLPAIQVRRAAEHYEADHFKKAAPKAPVEKEEEPAELGDMDNETLWANLELAINRRNRKRALQLIKQLKGYNLHKFGKG